MVKYRQWRAKRGHERAFALPTVLITAVILFIPLLAAFAAVSSIDVALNNQYIDKLTKEGSQSGMVMAKACLADSGNVPEWTNAKPLKPNTDCSGTELVSCTNASTDARCFVMKNANYRVSFKVTFDTDTDGNLTNLNSKGVVDQVRTTSGETFARSDGILKASGLVAAGLGDGDDALATRSVGTCAIAGGSLYCWGYGVYGQNGNNNTNQLTTPTAVVSPLAGKTVTKVSSASDGDAINGYNHTCAIADGSLYCWGYGGNGQIGNSSTTISNQTPTLVAGALAGKTVTDVETRNGGVCAIADGSLYCWGYGSYGQNGNGTTSQLTTPTAVISPVAGKTVTKVSSASDNATNSHNHTCAIADGSLYCWGYGGNAQMGNSNTNTTNATPLLVGGALAGKTVTDVVARNGGVCAIAGGTVYCWGYGADGENGNGSTSQLDTPAAVGGLLSGKTVTKISSANDGDPLNGWSHTCAIADSSLYCWGRGNNGQMGNSTTTTINSSPILIAGALAGKTVTDVETRNAGVCAIADGSVYCWGYGANGDNGTGSTSQLTAPTAVISPVAGKTVTGISSAEDNATSSVTHTCAIADGALYCWGIGSNGQLGNGSTSATNSTPIATSAGDGPWSVKATSMTLGTKHSCLAGSDNNAYCWGDNSTAYQLGDGTSTSRSTPGVVLQGAIPSGVGVKSISGGDYQNCVIGTNDKAYCWGDNGGWQLGDGTQTDRSSPIAPSQGAIPAGVTIKSVDSGSSNTHTCAVGSDNKAYCWGSNAYGQLGDNTLNNRTSPVAVDPFYMPSGVTFKTIGTGENFTCAIGSDDKAYCWGNNAAGQLGNGSSGGVLTRPQAVVQGAMPSGATIKSLSVGNSHACVIASDDKAYCWGDASLYRLGTGTGDNTIPRAVVQGAMPSGVTFKAISAGYIHTCAIGSDDKAYCWGYNNYSQLGDGTTANSNPPVAVSTTKTFKSIYTSISWYHTCAIGTDDRVYCWGRNSDGGQLGDGTTTNRSTPTVIKFGQLSITGGSASQSSGSGLTFY